MLSLATVPNFDPRLAPLDGVDSHLPAVPDSAMTPDALRQRFAHPPPWTPDVLRDRAPGLNREPADASVLLPIVMRDELTMLLTERTVKLTNHSGQIAFPGGRADPGDGGPSGTALRETREEVGIDARFIEVLGQLNNYMTVTAFNITPVVALVHPGFELRPNADEVADVFEVPLRFLLDPNHHQRRHLEWEGLRRDWWAMPFQDGDRQRHIWGATAGILRNFYRFMIS
ncbi:CoA pyrophosphatase [Diaphorobacter aerolatus]|uniref:CoA pyrophosphatase n=1 Tax=Diaphorobacter aerolatus TaxID=1288495 RepID=A0A7H0GQ85_9BURK|nr:CoA pyrophosphatase [Diaphorobacter aerolatus]